MHLVYTFRLFKANISPNMIVKPTRMLCYAIKWYGESQIHFRTEHHKDFIEKIYNMIDEADAIVHYNGKSFDMKHLNREFMLDGRPPPSSYVNIDLLTTFRSKFAMASNKLEWTSMQLGYDGKVQHRGIQLWIDCMANKRSAWKEMKTYNIQDVDLLEGVYTDILPWISGHPNWGHYIFDDDNPTCRNCGSLNVKMNGVERKNVRPYQRYKCNDCGAAMRSRKSLKHLPQPSVV